MASCAHNPCFVAAYNIGSPRESLATNNPVTYPSGRGKRASSVSDPGASACHS